MEVKVTTAQKELLDLLNEKEVQDFFTSLKTIHCLGTYYVRNDIADLSASRYVHNLLDAIQNIAIEGNKSV